MAGYVVVLDANVLYGIEITDFFATMATHRMFRPHSSPQILDEVLRNLRRRADVQSTAIERRIEYLNQDLPAASTEAPGSLARGRCAAVLDAVLGAVPLALCRGRGWLEYPGVGARCG